MWSADRSDALESTSTDADGAFEAEGLPAGRLSLEVEAAGLVADRRDVVAGKDAAVTVTLRRGGRLRARITPPEAIAAADVVAVVLDASGTEQDFDYVVAGIDAAARRRMRTGCMLAI